MNNEIQVTAYQLNQLEELFDAESAKNWNPLPINELRLASYLNNPRAEPTDEVFFTATVGGQMVSFRIVIPDLLFFENKVIRFAWNSGSWTHPDWRRKGISSKILKVVFEAWENRLAVTNTAQVSKKLFARMGTYLVFRELEGYKFFLHSDLVTLFKKRYPKGKWLWNLWKPIDLVLNIFNKKPKKINTLDFRKTDQLDEESTKFFDTIFNNKNGFLRDRASLNWIINYPWISEHSEFEEIQKKYQFTLHVKKTELKTFWIFKNDEKVGLIMLFLKNTQVTVPYLFLKTKSPNELKAISKFIYNQSTAWGGETVLIAEPTLANAYKKTQLFKYTWKRNQEYFISKGLSESLNLSTPFQIFDGDGDHVFSN